VQLEHSFTVPADLDTVWQAVLDPERVAPCMPGATLTEVQGSSFAGTVKVKLGPISLLYKGSGEFLETDEQARRLVIKASGKDSKGNGTAAATVTVSLKAEGANTAGSVVTDLTITGKPAQFGRGMISEVGGRILDTFASCLATKLAAQDASPRPSTAQPDLGTTPPSQDQPSVPAGTMDEGPPPGSGGGYSGEGTEARAAGATAGRAAVEAAAQVGTAETRPQLSVVGPEAAANGTRRAPAEPETESIDLLSYAGPSVAKRAAPLIVAAIVLLFIVARRRRSR
jgi:carbon monoxide dehydrogenase subunit G